MSSTENTEIIKSGLVSVITPLYNGEKYILHTNE